MSGDLEAILRLHAQKYSFMQPQDGIKLIYQNEFGCEHLIENPKAMLNWLKQEIAENEGTGLPDWEPIGNGLARLHLKGFVQDQAESILDAMMQTMKIVYGSPVNFRNKVNQFRSLSASGIFSFSDDVLNQWLGNYDGGPVHHSDVYRLKAHPAYRVVRQKLAEKLIKARSVT